MKHLKTFNSYQKKRINEKFELLSDMDLSDDTLFRLVFEKLLNDKKIDDKIRSEIQNYISTNGSLNEGFFDKLKERFPSASTVSKLLSDKAESVLSGILQKCKDAVSFVAQMKQGIKELFTNTITSSKTVFEQQFKTGKLKDKLEEIKKNQNDGLLTDIKTMKGVTDFYRKHFIGKLLSTTDTNLTQFLNSEQEPVVESLETLNEAGNVIATLVHKIEAIPPFSWLHKVAASAEKGINFLIKALSDLTVSLGGPAFEIPVISLILAIGVEYMVKSTTGHWLLELVGPTPLGTAIKGIKIVASFIASIVIIDSVIGGVILGGEHGEHGTEDSGH
jgi:hypothetical protein